MQSAKCVDWRAGACTVGYIRANNSSVNVCAYGDTVNMAARMEQHGQQGRVLMTSAAAKLLSHEQVCTPARPHMHTRPPTVSSRPPQRAVPPCRCGLPLHTQNSRPGLTGRCVSRAGRARRCRSGRSRSRATGCARRCGTTARRGP
eukprot:1333677-Rhodomonas_salina.1